MNIQIGIELVLMRLNCLLFFILIVGTEPVKVIDFKCRSYNWENLTCSFEKPNNPVPVNYTLYYGIGIGKPIFRTPVSNFNFEIHDEDMNTPIFILDNICFSFVKTFFLCV